jgi:hypothetical protein
MKVYEIVHSTLLSLSLNFNFKNYEKIVIKSSIMDQDPDPHWIRTKRLCGSGLSCFQSFLDSPLHTMLFTVLVIKSLKHIYLLSK